ATAVVARIESVRIPAGDVGASILRDNMLNGDLQTAATAAIRLGRYRQAEALARRWLAIPPNETSEADPQIKASRARSVLAAAVAMQGRGDEAQKTLQPTLAYYQQQQRAGAQGITFRHDYAYALYVSAISSATDAEGRERRKTALGEAATLITGASTEAQQLAEMREVTSLIAAARATH